MPEPPVISDGEENVWTFALCRRSLGRPFGELFEIGVGVPFAEFSKGGGGKVNLVPLVPETVRVNESSTLHLGR